MKGYENFEPESYYHIVNHAVGFDNLFKSEENYRYFLIRLNYHTESVFKTLAYCLIPNHIHLLVKVHDEKTLNEHPKFMKLNSDHHKLVMQQLSNLLNGYTKAFNKMYNRRGPLWNNFTKRFHINSDQYLTSTINYIHQNPVKHGFVRTATDWNHSSIHAIKSNNPSYIDRNEIIQWFGSLKAFNDFHESQSADLLLDWE